MWTKLASGAWMELPPAAVTVVQDEAEAIRTPGYDLRVLLDGAAMPWSLEYRTTSSAPIPAWSSAETVVFGFNAIHESEGLRRALDAQPPTANALILHQFGHDRLRFLRDELAIELRRVPGGRARDATAARGLVVEDELLLNWPHLDLELPVAADALNWLSFSPESAWRVVLEVECGSRRLPVLARTVVTWPQRLVACTLLLGRSHAPLVENLLAYCAFGRPEVAVVDLDIDPERPPTHDKAPAFDGPSLARSLRLQGARAVVVKPADRRVEVSRWPLKGAQNVVVPDAFVPDGQEDPAERRWRKAGGTVVQYDAEGRLTFSTDASAGDWAALWWITWYAGTDPASWLSSIFAARAVLRALDEVPKGYPAERDMGAPGDHERSIALLLGRRVRHGNCEQTISTTAAAWELNVLVGGRAVSPVTAVQMQDWLLERARDPQTTFEDRLEVARALGRREVLDHALTARGGDESPTAAALARLREAVLRCGVGDGTAFSGLAGLVAEWEDRDDVAATLRQQPLVAAEYLSALMQLHEQPEAHALARLDGRAVDAAVDTLVSHGCLARLRAGHPATAEEISTEALALVRYLGGRRLVGPINARTARVPDQLLPSVIEEVKRARDAEAAGQQTWRGLATAIPLLGAIALTAVLAGVADLAAVLDIHLELGPAPPIVLVALAAAFTGYRWWKRRTLDGDPPATADLALVQAVVGAITLLASLAAVLGALELFGWVFALLVGVLVVALVFGLLSLLLSSFDLVPSWTSRLIPALVSPGDWGKRIAERLQRGSRADR